jgi:uncharacterized protein with HEPN domain
VSRDADRRFADVLAAADAINKHLARGRLDDGLIFDAVRVRLIEIGEAVKSIDPVVLALEPDIPWIDIAAMRNHLAHRYFDTAHAIVRATLDNDLPPLVAAVRRLQSRLTPDAGSTDDGSVSDPDDRQGHREQAPGAST